MQRSSGWNLRSNWRTVFVQPALRVYTLGPMRVAGLILCWFTFVGLAQKPSQVAVRNMPNKEIGQASAIFSRGKTHSQIAVQTNPLRLLGDTTEGLYLSPNFIVQGRRLVAPPAIEFEFISYSAEPKFTSNHNFQVQTNGQMVFSQSLTLITAGRSREGNMTEVLVTKIPYATFLGLIKGSSLSLIVGGDRLELSEGSLEALRDLKRMIDARISF